MKLDLNSSNQSKPVKFYKNVSTTKFRKYYDLANSVCL